MTLHRLIRGKPYTFVRNRWGWGICATEHTTDRLYRSYQVRCAPDGTPLDCSCPDCHHARSWCKHLREVEAINKEIAEKKPIAPVLSPVPNGSTHYLNHSSKRRSYSFRTAGATVIVERIEGPLTVEHRELPLEQARRLYAFLLRKVGYQKF